MPKISSGNVRVLIYQWIVIGQRLLRQCREASAEIGRQSSCHWPNPIGWAVKDDCPQRLRSSILRLREPHASADRLLRPLHQLCSGGIPIADAPPPLPPLESRGSWPDVQLARHCRPAHQERERVSRLNNSIVLLVMIIL